MARFEKGERVYVLWPEGQQRPGTVCDEGFVVDDRDDEVVIVVLPRVGTLRLGRERVRRDRRERDRRGSREPVPVLHG